MVDLTKLSDAELQSISSGNLGSLSDETLRMIAGEAPPPAGDYRVEAARKGLAGSAGMVSGAANVMFDTLSRLGINPLELGMRAAGQPAQAPAAGVVDAYRTGREAVRQPLMQALGTTGVQPQGGGQKIMAAGIEAATSPESYLFPALAATRRMGMFGQSIMRPAEQIVVGAGAEGGGQAGGAFGAKMGGETGATIGQITGGLLGGAGSAYGAGTALKALPLAGKGFDVVKGQWDKVRGTVPEDELLKDVDNRISNIFIAAGAADPNFMKLVTDAAKAQESVSLKAPGGAAVQMPVSALLADNPVINNFIQNLSSRDPVFRAQYGDQLESAKAALLQNQIRLFGDPTKAIVTAAGPDLAKAQARRVKSLDEQIADAYKSQSVDPNVFGQRVSNLVAQKEKAAYAEVKPLYTEAFDIAKTKNVELPAGSVDDIYNFVAGERASDVFKTFPSIYSRVQSRFRPTTTEPSAILTAEGAPMTPGGKEFSAATIEDLDSLKREINRQLSKTDVPTDIRLLSELKARVGGHIDNLDPEFVTAYRNADKAYLQKVGLPFDTATLAAVDRKKFVEQIAPAIIGNKSNVTEFVNAVGPEGTQLVRSAFLDSFTNAALKNDVLDPKAAAKWLKKNEGGVSMVPGLRDELQAATTDVQQLIAQRSRLNAEFQRVAGDQIISAQGMGSAQDLVNKMYGDVKFTNKFMQQYGANKDSVNAVRSFMLDDLVSSKDPIAALSDRNNAAVFNRVFGPTYAQKVQDFVTVTDRLAKDITNVPFRGETVPRTPIEQLTGVPPEQILSRIYNPVSGATYAITSLFSKFWAKKASEATEARLKELLLNPSDAIKVFQAVQPRAAGFDQKKIQDAIDVGRKYGVQWVADAVQDATTGAARGAVQEPQE